MRNFSDRILLIVGGTGSFGHAVLRRFLLSEVREIRIFSRDELKQSDMRQQFRDSRVRYYLGDVRDANSIRRAMRGVDFVFNAAALKQVPACEFHPLEALKTNVLGTENVLRIAIEAGVRRVICLSTDKAVYPINAMGITKALMEKVMLATSRSLDDGQTTVCATRYGNVMASRGSVIPLFVQQVLQGIPLTLTQPSMTRFMMSMDAAIDLVMFAFAHARGGDIFVRKAPAATMQTVANATLNALQRPDHPLREIGPRHGEKLFESLVSAEEMRVAEEVGNYFRIPADSRDLDYSTYIEQGLPEATRAVDYNSQNTTRLDLAETTELLLQLDVVQQARKHLANAPRR